jgi:hypothetical protein
MLILAFAHKYINIYQTMFNYAGSEKMHKDYLPVHKDYLPVWLYIILIRRLICCPFASCHGCLLPLCNIMIGI